MTHAEDVGLTPATEGGRQLRIRSLRDWDELRECVTLQEETWGPGFGERVPATILRLSQRLGGVAAGAFDDSGRMLGFVFGMIGLLHGEVVLWSDMLAVRAEARNRGIGEALKRHQREEMLARAVNRICWTFEPLEAKNAYINFARLGAVAREYIRDFYGESVSPLHHGVGTDRLVAVWDIGSDRVGRRLAGAENPPAARDIENLPLINPSAGALAPGAPALGLTDARLRLAIPSELQSLKAHHPAIAAEWRATTRAALESYLARGYAVTELVRSGELCSYLLRGA
jgi:predicted GNAT superfamily acetyltransferase